MDEKALTAEEVRAWLFAIEDDLGRIAEKLQPLLNKQRQLEERQALLRELLRSFEPTSVKAEASTASNTPPNGSVARYVLDRALEILRDEGRPLHINDLHARFLERGYRVPGAGTPANLIVHLRKVGQIASPQRGVYGLAEQVGEGSSTPQRPRKRTTTRARRRRRKG